MRGPGGSRANTPRSLTTSSDGEEFVEVWLDMQEDGTIESYSVKPETAAAAAAVPGSSGASPSLAELLRSRSPAIMRSSSHRLPQSSQEFKAGAMSRAKQWSLDLTKRFRRTASSGNLVAEPSAAAAGLSSGIESALAARAERRKRAQLDRTKSGAQCAMSGLRFISGNSSDAWIKAQRNFDRLAHEGFLSRADFPECIGMPESKEFAMELFDTLTRQRRRQVDHINKDELRKIWQRITDDSFDSRLQIFFDMVDKNLDGRITEEEVKEIIVLTASTNKLWRLKEQAEEYAALLMEELDPDGLGYIELWQLETLLLQEDTNVNYSQALSYTSQALSQKLDGLMERSPIRQMSSKLSYYLEDNWKRLWVLALWIGIMAGLFIWKNFQYRNRYIFNVMGYCVTVATGAAETLKMNMALILLPVCHNTITWMRNTRAARALPFDDNLNFHKNIAAAIVVGVILHAGNHLICDFPRLTDSLDDKYAPLKQYFGNTKPTYLTLVKGVEGVTGFIMIVCMLIAFTLATKWFRHSLVNLPKPFDKLAGFNAFWYSHHLFTIVYISLVIHGEHQYLNIDWYKRTTWMYLAVPVCLYIGERTLRFFRSGSYPVRLLKVAIYPGNVLVLQISKPPTFRYKSGQYMLVQCPAVSRFEWHPFSITSAHGDAYLSIHVQQLGDWTREITHIISAACEPPMSGKSGLLSAGETSKEAFPKFLIDGPYGSPAQDYRKYDVVLLIGLGISATPFISILKDLINKIKMEEDEEASTGLHTQVVGRNKTHIDPDTLTRNSSKPKSILKTKNCYFYWVTREQSSFDWFTGVMNEIAELDQKNIIEIHNYLTSVYEEGDARSALIEMLQALNHAKNGVDIVSGTRVRTHFARPNIKRVLSELASKHPYANIGVFYGGAPVLARELSTLCHEYNAKCTTKFEFHKQHF